jgi:hypothetical protein
MNYIHINEMDEIKNHISSVRNPIIFVVKEGTEGFYGKVFDNFGFIYGDRCKGLIRMINNFIKYESTTERTPFIFILKNAKINENDMEINDKNEWAVHSTDKKSLESIIKMGKLLSRIELDKQEIKYLDFGRKHLNEPYDYYDFIEFGEIDRYAGEIVVASKIQNRFANENDEYNPGGRIYIKKETLMGQNGYIEFLDHYCIKGMLDLSKAEHKIISVDDFRNGKWTPRIFTEEANKLFNAKNRNLSQVDSSNFA